MNAGSIVTSSRLQATMNFLSDSLWHNCFDIQKATGSMAVHSDMAALRHPKNAISIQHRYNGKTKNGSKRSEYCWNPNKRERNYVESAIS